MRNERQAMENALADLQRRIRLGEEFPDAVWRVCQHHAVRSTFLESAYDEAEQLRNLERS